MKHESFESNTHMATVGDTADLRRCLWLSPMKAPTRRATLGSLATLCRVSGIDGELPLTLVRDLVEAPSPEPKAQMAGRWPQVASDVRRALRAWNDLPTRQLALSLRGRVPTFTDAVAAAHLRFEPGEATRAANALVALAESEGEPLEALTATLATVEPMLRRATPESFSVASMKTLENKRTLVRKSVRLVDPVANGLRETSVATLPADWQRALTSVGLELKEHETSQAAILRRLAFFCSLRGLTTANIEAATLEAFVEYESRTHAPGFVEKIRRAFRCWNSAALRDNELPRLTLPGASTFRQESVSWERVPPDIREPLDAFLETAVSARNPGDWGDFVPDEDPEYAELGIAFIDPQLESVESARPLLERGSCRNWRDAVKRAWHAATEDPRIASKPATLDELFAKPVVTAMVASARRSRRDRLEAEGGVFDPKVKGRYEHSLVEALCSVGRALSLDPTKVEVVENMKKQLDPNVVGMKRQPDGSFKRVYAERRIGRRHATMLAEFADGTRLKRYFEAPSHLWQLACAPLREGRKPQARHVALARTALIARVGQYVAPLRRSNHARLRHRGEDPHLILPVGDGVGTLRIPAQEGKTLRELHVEIDRETVRMLKYYISHFLPVAQKLAKATADNPHLFPGADGGAPEDGGYAPGRGFHTKSKLNSTFKRHMKKYCGLNMCLHVMRHLAGKIILDQDPSAMSLVKEILNHKRLQTTQAYYAEVSKIIAQRRYLHLLERQSREVLASIKFKFIDPTTGKEI